MVKTKVVSNFVHDNGKNAHIVIVVECALSTDNGIGDPIGPIVFTKSSEGKDKENLVNACIQVINAQHSFCLLYGNGLKVFRVFMMLTISCPSVGTSVSLPNEQLLYWLTTDHFREFMFANAKDVLTELLLAKLDTSVKKGSPHDGHPTGMPSETKNIKVVMFFLSK
jgi:hypothetical protein